MSNEVFPSLRGMRAVMKRRANFRTDVQEARSGAEFRVSRMESPRWHWSLSLQFALDDGTASEDFEKLLGLFVRMRGAQDSFLFSPPDRTLTETNAVQMTGDGTTKSFYLRMPWGAAGWEWVRELDASLLALTVKVGGTTTAVTTTTEDGLIKCTFATAPANGAVVTASFGYRYRVRFVDDSLEVERFAQGMFRQKGIDLVQVFA